MCQLNHEKGVRSHDIQSLFRKMAGRDGFLGIPHRSDPPSHAKTDVKASQGNWASFKGCLGAYNVLPSGHSISKLRIGSASHFTSCINVSLAVCRPVISPCIFETLCTRALFFLLPLHYGCSFSFMFCAKWRYVHGLAYLAATVLVGMVGSVLRGLLKVGGWKMAAI